MLRFGMNHIQNFHKKKQKKRLKVKSRYLDFSATNQLGPKFQRLRRKSQTTLVGIEKIPGLAKKITVKGGNRALTKIKDQSESGKAIDENSSSNEYDDE